jgi:hypothetical protein
LNTARPTTGANKTALRPRARAPGGGERSGSEEEMADAEEGGAEAEDVTMVESTPPTTTAMPAPFVTVIATAPGARIEPENKNGTGVAPPFQCSK